MNDYVNPSISESLLIALIGFVTVFVVLIVLMYIIAFVSKIFSDKKSQAAPVQQPAASPAPAEPREVYTGVKLNGVDEKTAAILMAIVADKMDKPLDNLRFISIKEVK